MARDGVQGARGSCLQGWAAVTASGRGVTCMIALFVQQQAFASIDFPLLGSRSHATVRAAL